MASDSEISRCAANIRLIEMAPDDAEAILNWSLVHEPGLMHMWQQALIIDRLAPADDLARAIPLMPFKVLDDLRQAAIDRLFTGLRRSV